MTSRKLIRHALEEMVANEATSKPIANAEREMVFYAKLSGTYLEALDAARARENQEQWEIRVEKTNDNARAGRMRVRKTWPVGKDSGEVSYVFTSKTKLPDGMGELEISLPSTKEQFLQFRAMSSRGMRKTRYVFDIPGRPDKWEVDFYTEPSGSPSLWVKIDLEVTDGNYDMPAFPKGLIDENTVMTNKDATDEVKAMIRKLYETVFMCKNPELQAAEEVPHVEPEAANEAPPREEPAQDEQVVS